MNQETEDSLARLCDRQRNLIVAQGSTIYDLTEAAKAVLSPSQFRGQDIKNRAKLRAVITKAENREAH